VSEEIVKVSEENTKVSEEMVKVSDEIAKVSEGFMNSREEVVLPAYPQFLNASSLLIYSLLSSWKMKEPVVGVERRKSAVASPTK
jgi:hypothetical protein